MWLYDIHTQYMVGSIGVDRRSVIAQQNAPKIQADFDAEFLKLNYQMNLGEVLGKRGTATQHFFKPPKFQRTRSKSADWPSCGFVYPMDFLTATTTPLAQTRGRIEKSAF